jgi:hypothetical protein
LGASRRFRLFLTLQGGFQQHLGLPGEAPPFQVGHFLDTVSQGLFHGYGFLRFYIHNYSPFVAHRQEKKPKKMKNRKFSLHGGSIMVLWQKRKPYP